MKTAVSVCSVVALTSQSIDKEILALAVLGFIPGFVLSLGLYQITYAATALPVVMETGRAVFVFSLTLVICSGSGLIALGKLRSADPADIF